MTYVKVIRTRNKIMHSGLLSRVVQSKVKITQGYFEIWIQIRKLKKQIQFLLFAYNLMIECSK